MSNTIHSFLTTKHQNPNQLLMVRDQEVVVVNKKDIDSSTLFKAKFGFGKASLRCVSKWVIHNKDQMESGTHARFNRYVKTYNKNQAIWKKGKTNSPKPLTDFSQKNSVDYQAEALFVEVQSQYRNQSGNVDLESLIEKIDHLATSIMWLDREDKKSNKALLLDILKLKAKIKHCFADNAELKDSLKNLQSSVLKMHFAKRLDRMDTMLTHLENRFDMHKEMFGNHQEFIENQLQIWRTRLNAGKPISIPKWYHCTKTSALVITIADSRIKYMHKGAFPGAFVSNKPETTYGNYGIAMSDTIEKTGTRVRNKKYAKLPKKSSWLGNVKFGEVHDDDDLEFKNKQHSTTTWLGFQKRSGIPLKKSKKINNPLIYYKDTSVAYIFYQSTSQDIKKIEAFGKKRKISVISYDQIQALRSLINATYELALPECWEGNIRHFNLN